MFLQTSFRTSVQSYTDHMWGHIVAPVLLTDGDWKRLLGSTALLQGCDGHLITWLTEVIRHLHPIGVSARPWPPLPPSAATSSQSRFMHMAITHISCCHYKVFTAFPLCSCFSVGFKINTCTESTIRDLCEHIFSDVINLKEGIITYWFDSLNLYQSNDWRFRISPWCILCCV